MKRQRYLNEQIALAFCRADSTTPGANFRAAQVVEVLDQRVRLQGRPKSLRVDTTGWSSPGGCRPPGRSLPKTPSGAAGWNDETRGT